ncbi:MAG: amino acid decarboxylase [Candidatus Eremiobacteraeota bacterium]|nr:amino acid decarboxylase [Candidatus Eremiobacteraeota bacterium]
MAPPRQVRRIVPHPPSPDSHRPAVPPAFRAEFDRVAAWIERYLRETRAYPVLSQVRPGELLDALPARAPEDGEPFDRIFADFERLVIPGITHWNHPRFFAYFAISAAPIAVLAEALAAALDVNAMLWRTSPAATELEDVTLAWLRAMLGLPDAFHGIVYDTASIGGFTALAAARERLGLDIRTRGMAGRTDLPAPRVYVTEHTHSHIEKGAIALGIGRENVVRVAVDDRFAMRSDALAVAIDADRAAGRMPMCAVATVGTTSVTASDPVAALRAVTAERDVWLHVDAAYGGVAAILPEFRHLLDGAHAADSIVVNPHKWLFVPVDLSVLYVRDPELLRRTFSLVADYLVTPEIDVRNYMDYGLQLGRRFRALKFWFVLRAYGVRGLQTRLRDHIALAQRLASWIAAEPGWEIAAPHPLSVVCFRRVPNPSLAPEDLDALNLALADAVNATGEVFLSTTRLNGRVVLRIAIGNERTTEEDVALCWSLLKRESTPTERSDRPGGPGAGSVVQGASRSE